MNATSSTISAQASETSATADTHDTIRVHGARENNLKDVDVEIPRDALVVFTGVSGSGKSSLAFGTLYAEAQRRYFESVAPYARRLIDQAGVPEVDSIEGLPPAIAFTPAASQLDVNGSLAWWPVRAARTSPRPSPISMFRLAFLRVPVR